MMRLSRSLCTLCGRSSHVASDNMCKKGTVSLTLVPVILAMKKSLVESRQASTELASTLEHRDSVLPDHKMREQGACRASLLPSIKKVKAAYCSGDVGRRLIAQTWKKASDVGLLPRPPPITLKRTSSVKVSPLSTRLAQIRNTWPYQ